MNFVTHNPKIFLCIPTAAANAAAVCPNSVKTHLINALRTFFVKGKLVFSYAPKSLPRNLDCAILASWFSIILY